MPAEKSPLPDAANVLGNAPLELKQYILDSMSHFAGLPSGFATSVFVRLELKEIFIELDARNLKEAVKGSRVVFDITVEEDMANTRDNMHGGCSAYLIDTCSSIALMALSKAKGRDVDVGVSVSLDVVYHSPAVIGDRIRIVNTTLSMGGRTMSARSEIWNTTHHRLVASGVHIKMTPSPPKPKL